MYNYIKDIMDLFFREYLMTQQPLLPFYRKVYVTKSRKQHTGMEITTGLNNEVVKVTRFSGSQSIGENRQPLTC